jgi:hypothetical protein
MKALFDPPGDAELRDRAKALGVGELAERLQIARIEVE